MPSLLSLLFASLPVVLAGTTPQCVRDSCGREVASGLLNPWQFSSRSSDCAAFLSTVTKTPSAVTVTVKATPSPRTTTLTSSISTAVVAGTTSIITVTDSGSVYFAVRFSFSCKVYGASTATSSSVVLTTSFTTTTQVSQTTTTIVTTTTSTGAADATVTAKYGKRAVAKVPQWACSCPDVTRFSSACACVGSQPRTVTASARTVYVTQTVAAPTSTVYVVGQTTINGVATSTVHTATTLTVLTTSVTQATSTTTTVSTSSTTSTTTTIVGGAALPTGSIGYCSDGTVVDGASSGYTGAGGSISYLRIEGASDTIYEGYVLSGPQSITTPSGGTHQCDGTNNGANPTPFNNALTMVADAGRLCGFDFDGTYSSQFDDFFITRIDNTQQTSNQLWGLLENYMFTPAAACETEALPTDQILWAYNAFNSNFFLQVSPAAVTLSPGQTYTVRVTGNGGNGDSAIPIAGASFNGLTTDANGNVQFVAPTTPGTYRYKATRSDSVRSNALVVTVSS